jgi:hypothetical protein
MNYFEIGIQVIENIVNLKMTGFVVINDSEVVLNFCGILPKHRDLT